MILCPNTGRKPWHCHCDDCTANRLAILPDVPVRPNLAAGFVRPRDVLGQPGTHPQCRSIAIPVGAASQVRRRMEEVRSELGPEPGPEPAWHYVTDTHLMYILRQAFHHLNDGLNLPERATFYQDYARDGYVIVYPSLTFWMQFFLGSEDLQNFMDRCDQRDDAASMFFCELALDLPPRAVTGLHSFRTGAYRVRVIDELDCPRFVWLHESVLTPIRARFIEHRWQHGVGRWDDRVISSTPTIMAEAVRQLGIPHLAEEPRKFYQLPDGWVGLLLPRPELWLQFLPRG